MEATALARRLADAGVDATVSFAGRVERPKRQPLPTRIGGFGGAEGLAAHIRQAGVTHVVDATHPFAARMSRNAVAACRATGTPLCRLSRPPWTERPGDRWMRVPDIAGAVAALDRPRTRVMLAVGRMHLDAFAPNPQHAYLIRLVDPPAAPLALPEVEVIVDRGPFDAEADRALMVRHGTALVVSKNSGGAGAYAKIAAARALGLPVVMIDRPALPPATEATDPEGVLAWLSHASADLGV